MISELCYYVNTCIPVHIRRELHYLNVDISQPGQMVQNHKIGPMEK